MADQKDVALALNDSDHPFAVDERIGHSEEVNIASHDGTKLHGYVWKAKTEARAVVAYVHGFASHARRASLFAHAMREQGIHVVAISYRGHGKSEGPRGHFNKFSDVLGDVNVMLSWIAERFKEPCVLLGHSQGGLVVTRYLEEMSGEEKDSKKLPLPIQALVLSSPFNDFGTAPNCLEACCVSCLSPCMPGLALPLPDLSSGLSHDPFIVRNYQEDPLVFSKGTLGWLAGIKVEHALVLQEAHRIALPVLMAQGLKDPVVSVSTNREVFASFSSKDKTFKGYDEGFHEIFNETEDIRQAVYQDVLAFIKRIVP